MESGNRRSSVWPVTERGVSKVHHVVVPIDTSFLSMTRNNPPDGFIHLLIGASGLFLPFEYLCRQKFSFLLDVCPGMDYWGPCCDTVLNFLNVCS